MALMVEMFGCEQEEGEVVREMQSSLGRWSEIGLGNEKMTFSPSARLHFRQLHIHQHCTPKIFMTAELPAHDIAESEQEVHDMNEHQTYRRDDQACRKITFQ